MVRESDTAASCADAGGRRTALLPAEASLQGLFAAVHRAGGSVVQVREARRTMEETFLDAVGGGPGAAVQTSEPGENGA